VRREGHDSDGHRGQDETLHAGDHNHFHTSPSGRPIPTKDIRKNCSAQVGSREVGSFNLEGLDLAGVEFRGAYLFLTQFKAADLSRAVGLTQEQLAIACGTRETKLPVGVPMPSGWPCSPEGD